MENMHLIGLSQQHLLFLTCLSTIWKLWNDNWLSASNDVDVDVTFNLFIVLLQNAHSHRIIYMKNITDVIVQKVNWMTHKHYRCFVKLKFHRQIIIIIFVWLLFLFIFSFSSSNWIHMGTSPGATIQVRNWVSVCCAFFWSILLYWTITTINRHIVE